MMKKTMAFLEFGKAGKRKKALFLLGAVRCFNLILNHNLMDIYCFFDPNCFSPTLALAREVWVYLKVWLTDPEIIEELSEDSSTVHFELDLVLRIFNEIVKQFNIRLAYKDEHEQSKEFKNLYVIDTILLFFLEWKKLSSFTCPILVREILSHSKQLFQYICSLVGSFDFLFKHITENILNSTSIKEAEILRCLTFCIDSCYQNEARKKFLTFLKSNLSEIKTKETKSTMSLLLAQYGSDTYGNQLLALKDSQDTNNALEHILLRAVSIRDHETRLITADFLRSVAQFGDYYMISCVTRYLCLKTNQECTQLKTYGRASRELGNCLKLLALITRNPSYKSMLLAADAVGTFNGVLKSLLQNGCKEEDFPIFEVISNLFNPKMSINNLQRSADDPMFIDPIPRDQLSEFCKICSDQLSAIGPSVDEVENLDSQRLSTVANVFSSLAAFFDANYHDHMFAKEFTKKDVSVLYTSVKLLLATMKRQTKWTASRADDLKPLVVNYLRMVAAVLVPTVLSKDSYKSKRLKQIFQLLADDKESDRLVSLVEDMRDQARVIDEASQDYRGSTWTKMSSIWYPIHELLNSPSSFESLYKYAPIFEERDLVKKTSYYDSLFERTYNIVVPTNQLRTIELVRDTVTATAQLNDFKPVALLDNEVEEKSQPTLEFTVQTNLQALEEMQAIGLSSQTDANFVDGNIWFT